MIDSKVRVDSIANTFPEETRDISGYSSKEDKLRIIRVNLMGIFEELLVREEKPEPNKNNNWNDHPMIILLFPKMAAIVDGCYLEGNEHLLIAVIRYKFFVTVLQHKVVYLWFLHNYIHLRN